MPIQELLNKLLRDDTSKEDIDTIAQIKTEIAQLEETNKKSSEDLSKLKNDYIELVRNSGFKGDPQDKVVETPKSLEEIAQEIIKRG